MEKSTNAGRALVTFLIGGAMGMGAAFVMSRVCKMKGAAGQARKTDGHVPATPYCDVPEGADICFPQQ